MKTLLISIALLFVHLNIFAQNPIKTVPDNSNYLGKRFAATFNNFITISKMDIESYEKYCKDLGFDTKPTGNFCVLAYPQCREKLQNLGKCPNRLIYWWNDANSEISTLREIYNEISKQVESYRDEDGFTCFKILYGSDKFTFKFKSETGSNGLNETLLVDNEN